MQWDLLQMQIIKDLYEQRYGSRFHYALYLLSNIRKAKALLTSLFECNIGWFSHFFLAQLEQV